MPHGGFTLTNDGLQCSGTLENPHTPFFRFVELSPPPQAHDNYLQPPPTNPTVFHPPVEPGRCVVSGCTKRRVNVKCPRHACATHCRSLGGCPVNQHQAEGTTSMPSSSQVFQSAYQLNSQPPLITLPMINSTSTFLPPRSLPPASLTATQSNGGSSVEAQQFLAPITASQSAVHSGEPLQKTAVPSLLPIPIVAELRSLNPLPDPRFAPQMRPIFTSQSSLEQEMRENVRAIDEQRLDGVKKVKHTVTVCAWLSVCICSLLVFLRLLTLPGRIMRSLRNQFNKAGLSGPTSASRPPFSPMLVFLSPMKIHGIIYTTVHAGHGNGSRLTITSLWILQPRSSSRMLM